MSSINTSKIKTRSVKLKLKHLTKRDYANNESKRRVRTMLAWRVKKSQSRNPSSKFKKKSKKSDKSMKSFMQKLWPMSRYSLTKRSNWSIPNPREEYSYLWEKKFNFSAVNFEVTTKSKFTITDLNENWQYYLNEEIKLKYERVDQW